MAAGFQPNHHSKWQNYLHSYVNRSETENLGTDFLLSMIYCDVHAYREKPVCTRKCFASPVCTIITGLHGDFRKKQNGTRFLLS